MAEQQTFPEADQWFVDPDAAHPFAVNSHYNDGLPGTVKIAEFSYRPHAVLTAFAPKLLASLWDNLSAWEEEEASVQEEHADLIAATRALLDELYAAVKL